MAEVRATVGKIGEALAQPVRALATLAGPIRAVGSLAQRTIQGVLSPLLTLGKTLTSLPVLLAGVGGAIVAGRFVGALNATAARMDEVGKAARRLGLDVEQLSGIRYVAELSNVEWTGLAGAISTAQRNIGQFVTTGGGKAAEAFELLNVPLKDAQGRIRDIGELLPELADAINRLPDAQRQFAAQRIFGDESILSVLESGGAALRGRFEEAARLGVLYTKAQTDAAEQYRDSLSRVAAAWEGIKTTIVTAVAPAVTEFLNGLAYRLAEIPAVVKTVGQVLRNAFSIDAGIRDLGAAQLKALLSSVAGLVKTTFVNSAVVAASAFINTFKTAFAVIAPVLGDLLSDAIAGTAVGSKLGIEKSLSARLADARKKLRDDEASSASYLARWQASASDPNTPGFQQRMDARNAQRTLDRQEAMRATIRDLEKAGQDRVTNSTEAVRGLSETADMVKVAILEMEGAVRDVGTVYGGIVREQELLNML
ncbi:MAG: phage tail tape measure protein, partial [Phycisphaerales bacterium]|nr:phage tail tape measure protein [Phycisphaerales bacterium]